MCHIRSPATALCIIQWSGASLVRNSLTRANSAQTCFQKGLGKRNPPGAPTFRTKTRYTRNPQPGALNPSICLNSKRTRNILPSTSAEQEAKSSLIPHGTHPERKRQPPHLELGQRHTYRGTSLTRNSPPPKNRHRTLGILLL